MSQAIYTAELTRLIERERVKAMGNQEEGAKPTHNAYWQGYLQCLSWLEQIVENRKVTQSE